jgi:hypothetical protein
LIEDKKFGSLIQEPTLLYSNGLNLVTKPSNYWSSWALPAECDSGCLYGESGRLKEGSVGLKIFSRTCLDKSSKKCTGNDKKYETCIAKQCFTIPKLTVLEFANQICDRAKEFDRELIGGGLQKISAERE